MKIVLAAFSIVVVLLLMRWVENREAHAQHRWGHDATLALAEVWRARECILESDSATSISWQTIIDSGCLDDDAVLNLGSEQYSIPVLDASGDWERLGDVYIRNDTNRHGNASHDDVVAVAVSAITYDYGLHVVLRSGVVATVTEASWIVHSVEWERRFGVSAAAWPLSVRR